MIPAGLGRKDRPYRPLQRFTRHPRRDCAVRRPATEINSKNRKTRRGQRSVEKACRCRTDNQVDDTLRFDVGDGPETSLIEAEADDELLGPKRSMQEASHGEPSRAVGCPTNMPIMSP